MEFELKGALKKYRRLRSARRVGMTTIVFGAICAPWLFNLGRTDMLICLLGGLVVWTTGELEMRLKTIQLRLAGMDDRIIALQGQEPEDNLILELNDW